MADIALLKQLCSLVEAPLRSGFLGDKSVSYKSGQEVVTSVDLEVHRILRAALLGLGFRETELLDEEASTPDSLDPSGRLWIIDPIDGTREFVDRIPEFALSIAYSEGGQLKAGAVFNPIAQKLVCGTLADGLFVDGRRRAAGEPQSRHVLYSRSEEKKGLCEALKRAVPTKAVGSVAYKMALVAAGDAAATLSYQPKHSWDIAAGAFLTTLSGGKTVDLAGRLLAFDRPLETFPAGILASAAGTDHEALHRVFVESAPSEVRGPAQR